jgi:hypothetical protein
MKKRLVIVAAAGLAVAALLPLSPVPALAGEEFNLGNRPWDFTAQNRAGIAALIEQKKDGTLGGNGTGSGGGCGGNAGNSTAVGNYTCIIINESTAAIEILQKELGDQTANTQTQTAGGNMSDVLQDLNN